MAAGSFVFIDYKNGVMPQVNIKYTRGDRVFIHRASHSWTKFSGKKTTNVFVSVLNHYLRHWLVFQQILPSHRDIRPLYNKKYRDWSGGCLEEENVERYEGGILQQ